MSHVQPADDEQQIHDLMHAFYEVISFEEGGAPDWDRMQHIFSKHARITRVTPEAIDYMTLDDFRAMAEELIEVGVFTAFLEHELARRVERYGTVIHIASAYETRVSSSASDYLGRGVNSLQLVREAGDWKIVSLCWDDDAPLAVESFRAEHGVAS
ncbi:MAG: nuclear transport factor 2 family protein [Polyangiales bacterium]